MKLLLSLLCVGCLNASAGPTNRAEALDHLMTSLSDRGQFNGSVLVAVDGKVIYRNAFGMADFRANTPLTLESPSGLASVTKQFTAMAVMMLAEQGRLALDDRVSKFIPDFSQSPIASGITIRHLLNHTSGIPDYGDLGIDDSSLSEKQLITSVLRRDSVFRTPGERYQYCNPGYALLAIIVERVSGESFADFLDRRIFQPLEMGHTYVFDSPTKRRADAAKGYDLFGQEDDLGPTAIPGDGGMYSTVDDLFKWDQALYSDRLVRQERLAEAFTPGKVRAGASTYGFGWNITKKAGQKIVWHTGKAAGFRAYIGRRMGEKITVILLTNKGDSKRLEINDAILSILSGKPFTLPKRSGAEKLYSVIRASGSRAATDLFYALKQASNADFDFSESELNTLGYKLLYGDNRVADAIAIFRLNTTEHAGSSNAFDSLGEAYRKGGQKELALASYQKAVELDRSNLHAAAALKELR